MVKMNLPNLLIIGAAKSATTSLYNILSSHKDIFAPAFKEPHFFNIDDNFSNGIDWYSQTYFNKKKNQKYILDGTPTYLYSLKAAERIYKNLGSDVQFIVVLRNPVDRAYSHYLHTKRDGFEELSFLEALEVEQKRLNHARKSNDVLSELRFSYVSQGMYSNMLSAYLKFFSINNFLILDFDTDIKDNFKKSLEKIANFINIDLKNLDGKKHSNKSSVARSSFVKNILISQSWIRKVMKIIFYSAQTRQIIKNKIRHLNEKDFAFKPLSKKLKKELLDKYFANQEKDLENLIDKKIKWHNH